MNPSNKGRIMNLTGNRYGLLTVIRMGQVVGGDGELVTSCGCECQCGNKLIVAAQSLKRSDREGRTPSCGCALRGMKRQAEQINTKSL